MGGESTDQDGQRSESQWALIDEACSRFEAAWQTGQPPRIEDFLPAESLEISGPARLDLLTHLVSIDLEGRWQTADAAARQQTASPYSPLLPGEGQGVRAVPSRPRLADYAAHYPLLGPVEQLPCDLIVAEYYARCRYGDRPAHAEYLDAFGSRYPDLAKQLQAVDTGMAAAGSPRGPAAADAPPPGASVQYFGDYVLLDRLGKGGMGVVYKANQASLKRLVAVKMILAGQLAGEEDVLRFHSEAEAAAGLDHPNIVQIYEIGEHQGQHYFSMRYVEGESLAERLKTNPLPAHEAARLIEQVARAIAYAHGRGVIHRDLKPSNILVDRQGQPHVTDFGLAKRVQGDSDLTASGQVLGTPPYMPPEQAAGRVREISERSDVYSLGATLYALLAGRPPFQADNPLDTLLQVREQEPLALRQLNPKLPRDLETICAKCLEKSPARRYATATELADELKRFLAGEPIQARPVSRPERFWRWCKRQPVVAGLIGAVALTLVAGIIVSSMFAVSEKAQKKRADEKALQAAESLVDAVLAAPGDSVPNAIQNLVPLGELALPILERQYDGGQLPPAQQLHAAFAMAALGRVERDFLVESVASAKADERRNFIAALRPDMEAALQGLRQHAEKAAKNKDWPQKARFAIVALHLGEAALARDMLQVEQRPDPVQRTVFIKTFAAWHGDLADLLPTLEAADYSTIRSGVCCAMDGVSPDGLGAEEKKAFGLALQDWYRSKPDAATHSAAGFALGQWKLALPATQPQTGAQWYVNSIGMTMILIRSGTFLMSSLEPDNVPFYGGTLPPRVRITKPFWLGMHLVTVGQYRKFVEESKHDVDKTWWQNVGFQQTDDCPVVNVMWDDAKAFCEWLSRKEGRHYRLPTEAEWEYACRAGTRTLFSFGDDVSDLGDHAWFDMNSLGKTHAVGQKRPNAWGLFDMHGNASQWCQDWYDHRYYAKSPTDDPTGPAKGSLRVYRGGSWKYPAEFCRSLVRESDGAGVRRIYLGFRVCLVPADK